MTETWRRSRPRRSTRRSCAILLFFVLHWQLSVFFQSFFHHRYGAHRQFTMSKGWERVFHFLAWAVQRPSYLNPRAYAIMHRMHHAYSDTPKDPHSPVQQPNFFTMMWRTKVQYERHQEPQGRGRAARSRAATRSGSSSTRRSRTGRCRSRGERSTRSSTSRSRTHWWLFLLAPVHWLLGPIHGAIVNWVGHKLGYRNYDSDDNSKNTLVFDVLTMGELFQNNHHKWGQSPNFAVRWFEIDPAYQADRVFGWLGIIDLSRSQVARWAPVERASPPMNGRRRSAAGTAPTVGG